MREPAARHASPIDTRAFLVSFLWVAFAVFAEPGSRDLIVLYINDTHGCLFGPVVNEEDSSGDPGISVLLQCHSIPLEQRTCVADEDIEHPKTGDSREARLADAAIRRAAGSDMVVLNRDAIRTTRTTAAQSRASAAGIPIPPGSTSLP